MSVEIENVVRILGERPKIQIVAGYRRGGGEWRHFQNAELGPGLLGENYDSPKSTLGPDRQIQIFNHGSTKIQIRF